VQKRLNSRVGEYNLWFVFQQIRLIPVTTVFSQETALSITIIR
jgi:hypothetical protein